MVKGVLLTSNKKAQEGGGERVEGKKAGTCSWCGKLDPRKHRNNAMRCVLVGEERDGEVMQL